MRSKLRLLIPLCLLIICAGISPIIVAGCSMSAAQRDQILAQTAQAEATARAERDRLATEKAAQEAAGKIAEAAKTQKSIDTLNKMIDFIHQGHTVAELSIGPDGTIDFQPAATLLGQTVGGTYGPLIPIAALLITNVVTWLRGNQRKQDTISLIKGIDSASRADSTFNEAGNKAWPIVDASLTPGARALVNEHATT